MIFRECILKIISNKKYISNEIFAKAIINNAKFNVHNNGYMSRDFTYIEDITQSLMHLISKPAKPVLNF